MNYNGKKFKTQSNSSNGETSSETIFSYYQEGNLLKATYSGGQIKESKKYYPLNTKGISLKLKLTITEF